jgi:menaquinone-dependent protoporphyrinogen oxidase
LILLRTQFQINNIVKTKFMKTLIAYSSSHGCTEKIVSELKKLLGGEVQIINLKNNQKVSFEEYNRVIIGGSIHAGKIQKKVKDFCLKNLEQLKLKEIGLFISCMEEGLVAQKQLMDAFPAELFEVAKSTAVFGGEFNFEKMNFIEKFIVKKITGVKSNNSKVDHQAIHMFSKRMDKIFNPFLFLV